MIRTRAIISKLSYDELLHQGVIPDLVSLIGQSPTVTTTKRYPPFVYKTKEYAMFGVIMDYVIRAGLRINLQQKVEVGVDPVASIIPTLTDSDILSAVNALSLYETSNNLNDIMSSSLRLSKVLCGETSYTHEMLAGYVPTAVNIIKEIITKWWYFGHYLNGDILFNTEYSYGCFAGHPDIVVNSHSHSAVLDIKNTGSFTKMSKESSLQVLAYYALMKSTDPSVQYVGFVLPMQREVVIYNVGAWDSTRYLQILNAEGEKLSIGGQNIVPNGITNIDDLVQQLVMFGIAEPLLTHMALPPINIGSHISKGKNIAATLSNYTINRPGCPCQMFLTNPRTGKRDAKTAGQITSASQVIKENNLIYFTHAAYCINLSANDHHVTDGHWQQRILNEDLTFTVAMGGKGVVVHTGARRHRTEEEALTTMEHMVRTSLAYATQDCPLLLETPCGEGTEIVTKIEELGNFFFRFTEDERKKLGLCVDSCHVFSAGYDPLAYLQHWEQYCQTPIRLVHFNDSAKECGSHVDRHAAPGTGHIGLEKMDAIAKWCFERGIPMVRE